jgi:hypothetical protein
MLGRRLRREQALSLLIVVWHLHGDLRVKPAKEIDVPGAFDLSGEWLAIVILAQVREIVSVIAEHAAYGEWPLPLWRQLVHAILVLD